MQTPPSRYFIAHSLLAVKVKAIGSRKTTVAALEISRPPPYFLANINSFHHLTPPRSGNIFLIAHHRITPAPRRAEILIGITHLTPLKATPN